MIRFTLNELMEKHGWDNKYVIEKTGINRNTVKTLALPGGINRIDFKTLNRLCIGLGVTPDQLIKYEYVPEEDDKETAGE
jgi:putative transcriptional regulator